jgi:hypothetical protein
MKIWFASYPRSGNTLLRIIMNEAFGIKSGSIYPEAPTGIWAKRVGFAKYTLRLRRRYGMKTHGYAQDQAPAIYVVRDGRAAVVSYFHWLRAEGEAPTLEDIISGKVWAGSWSAHVSAWSSRPNTLLIKFEDLIGDNEYACRQIGDFLGIHGRATLPDFAELQAMSRTHFRSGNNQANIAELASHIDQFDKVHGDAMRQLGYY